MGKTKTKKVSVKIIREITEEYILSEKKSWLSNHVMQTYFQPKLEKKSVIETDLIQNQSFDNGNTSSSSAAPLSAQPKCVNFTTCKKRGPMSCCRGYEPLFPIS